MFKIKNGHYLELLMPEIMKLLRYTENKIAKDKNGENITHLDILTFCHWSIVILVHCIIVNNDYQKDSRVLHTFVPNKPFGNLLGISPAHLIPLTFNSEFAYIDVWFNQNSQPLKIKDRLNLTLIIKWCSNYINSWFNWT